MTLKSPTIEITSYVSGTLRLMTLELSAETIAHLWEKLRGFLLLRLEGGQVKQKQDPEAAVEGFARKEIGRPGSHTAQAVASSTHP